VGVALGGNRIQGEACLGRGSLGWRRPGWWARGRVMKCKWRGMLGKNRLSERFADLQ